MLLRAVLALAVFALGLVAAPAVAATWPDPVEGTYVVPEFRFADGETMRDLRLHYVTLGTPHRDASGRVDNAVLILHGTGGNTNQFLSDRFAGELFVPNGLLDAAKYFIVITDGIGHGKSSKPSDGLHAKFPHYGYRDMVRAQHDVLVNALHVDHLRLVMGTSMGGMQIERFSGSWTHIVLWHPGNNDGKSDDWPHYVYMSYPSKDAVAAKIARSYRVNGHKKQC